MKRCPGCGRPAIWVVLAHIPTGAPFAQAPEPYQGTTAYLIRPARDTDFVLGTAEEDWPAGTRLDRIDEFEWRRIQ